MPAEPRLTDYDLEQLSAYLDNELTVAERAALDTRLAQEPELRRELASLRQTVALIKTAPPIRAPRNFTLTPQMVRPPRVLIFPTSAAFSAMSAAAAVVLLIAGVVLLNMRPTLVQQPTRDAAAVAQASTMTATLRVDSPAANQVAPSMMPPQPSQAAPLQAQAASNDELADNIAAPQLSLPAPNSGAETSQAFGFVAGLAEETPTTKVSGAMGGAVGDAPTVASAPGMLAQEAADEQQNDQAGEDNAAADQSTEPQIELFSMEQDADDGTTARSAAPPAPSLAMSEAEESAAGDAFASEPMALQVQADTLTATVTSSPTPTDTPTATVTPSATPSETATPTATVTPSVTPSPTPTPAPFFSGESTYAVGLILIVLAVVAFGVFAMVQAARRKR